MEGWIKLHRKILENPIMKRPSYAWLWITLLLKANHKEQKLMWNKEIIMIKEGQLITGRKELSACTGIPETTIEDILNFLEKSSQIRQQKTTKFRLITVINWKDYQASDNKPTTNRQQTDTNKNDNNEKKESDASVVIPKTYNNFRDRARVKLGKEPMGSRPMTQSQKRSFNELLALEPDISLYKELAGSVGFSYLELPEDANSKVRRQMLSARSRFQEEVHDFYRWIFTTSNPWPKKVNYHPESCITSIMFDAYKNKNSENKDNSILKSWGV